MRRALFLLTLAACGSDLSVPQGLVIQCTSDADCPGDRFCDEAANQCRLAAKADTTPPSLVSVTADGPELVTVVFDEPLDGATASDVSHYTTVPPLVFSAATPQGAGQTVALAVEREDVVTYTLTVTGVSDEAGNGIVSGASAQFLGIAATPNRSPPIAIQPADGFRVFGTSTVSLFWTAREGASSYTVEVYVGDNGHPIPGSPFTVVPAQPGERPPATLDVVIDSAATYEWTVRADISEGASAPARIEGIGDTLFVSCPALESCDDDGRAGNVTNPHRSIVSAIADAQLNGIGRVHVAGRGGGAAYDELVSLADGVSVFGGYSADFAAHDPEDYVTAITSGSYVLYASGITSPTIVDGFRIVGSTGSLTHPVELVSTARVTLSNLVVDVQGNPASTESIGINVLAPGPDVTLDHVAVTLGGGALSLGVHVDAAPDGSGPPPPYALTMRNLTVVSGGSAAQATGIDLHGTTFSLTDSLVAISLGSRFTYGVTAANGDASTMLRNSIQVTGAFPHAVIVTQQPSGVSTIADNAICARGTAAGIALDIGQGSTSVVNNTICSTQTGVRLSGSSVFTNNIVFYSTNQPVCLSAAGGSRFENNLFFNCSTPISASNNATAVASINDCASYATAGMLPAPTSCSGNVVDTSDIRAYFVNDAAFDFHLASSASAFVSAGGMNTGTADYGNVTVDRDNVPRTCVTPGSDCYSIGAYEKD